MASSTPVEGLLQSVNGAQGKPPRHYAGVNLFVKNLDATFDDKKLWEVFSPYGLIISCKVQVDEIGTSKGFGFVCFTNVSEASSAISELNGRVVGTKPLYVALFESKEERQKNRLKKVVEYMGFSADMVKPSNYEEFLKLSMARGRGRGRSSDPVVAPELPFGTGMAVAARTPFSPPRARMPSQSPELLLGSGLVNSMAARTPFSSPRPQMSPRYSGVTGATGAIGAMDQLIPEPISAEKPKGEQQLPTGDVQAMAQLAAYFLQKHEHADQEMHPIYEEACLTPSPRAALSPNTNTGDSSASSSRYASMEYMSPFVYRASSDNRASAGSLDFRASIAGSPCYRSAASSPNGAGN